MAAAIITPARLDLRLAHVERRASPCRAPSDISSASSSSPASRHAVAGSRRKRARNAGSASRRSISWAATSASVGGHGQPSAPQPLRSSGLPSTTITGRKNATQSVPMHGVHDHVGGRELLEHDRLVAQRHRDREAAPPAPTSRARRASSGRAPASRVGGPRRRQPARELLLRAPPQPRLAQAVDEDVVAVALDERVEVEERADVGRERELEEDVARRCPPAAAGSTSANSAPSEKSDTGPAALIAIRRRRGSNHASEVSTNAYGKISDQLEARRARRGARTTPSSARARSRARPRPRSARAGTRGRRARSCCATTNGVP